MEIKVYGPGCPNCMKVHEMALAAVAELGIEATVEKVTDMLDIARAGIMSTPGLVVDGKVKYTGKPLPDQDQVKEFISQEMLNA